MLNLRVWQKLSVLIFILLLAIGVLGYSAVTTLYNRYQNESLRLAGLDYVKALRSLVQGVHGHRTAAYSIRAAKDEATKSRNQKLVQDQKLLEESTARVDQAIAEVTKLNEGRDALLKPADARWPDIQQRWEDVKRNYINQKPEEVNKDHSQLQALALNLVNDIADTSGMIFVNNDQRYYLYDSLVFKILPQSELVGQAQAQAFAVAVRRELKPEEKPQLIQIASQIKGLGVGVLADARRAWRDDEPLQEKLETLVKDNTVSGNKLVAFINENILTTDRIDAAADTVFKNANDAFQKSFALFDAEWDAAAERTRVARDNARFMLLMSALLIAMTLLVSVLLAWLITRSITGQIAVITALFKEIEQGNYQTRARVLSRDELGRLAESLNRMLDLVLGLIQSRDERDSIQGAIMKLLDEVSGVAQGDLTIEAEVTADVTGALADSFNYMIAELRKIIGYVQDASAQVTSSASQLQALAEHLSQGSEAQAQQIVSTSSSLEEVATAVRQVSENATVSAAVAQQALGAAKKGSTSVQNTIQGMNKIRDQVQETAKRIKRLGESTQEIGQILQLIEDLADRTSILALNAAIQASLAGEAGRGFALVAEEVERLADRSTEATKKIATLIKTIQGETKEAVTAMEETTREVVDGSGVANSAGQALVEIESVSLRLAELIQAISTAARQQARGSESLAKSMNQISKVTQETAGETKQAADAASVLTTLADDLRSSVSTFRIPQTDLSGHDDQNTLAPDGHAPMAYSGYTTEVEG